MNQRLTQCLLAIAVVLLAVHLFRPAQLLPSATAEEAAKTPAVLRAQSIELVDTHGKVVAQLHVGEDGGGNLRLRSGDGTVRVKLGAAATGSGLILFDTEAEPAVWLTSNKSSTSVTLAEKGKEKRVIKP